MPRTRLRSRLRFSLFRDIDGVMFWDRVDYPVLAEQPDDLTHTVRDFERIDLLAYQYYGDVILWPIIALANEMELIPADLNVGAVLRIPSPRYVREELFKRPRVKF